MQFSCLIWYSNLALPAEDNEFVANFLGQACKVIQKEIDEIAGDKYQLNLEFLHIEKGEEGLKQLFDKFATLQDGFFTNAHSIAKYNDEIIKGVTDKRAFIFHQSPSLATDVNKNIFGISRVDRQAKLSLIDDEISRSKDKILFLHNEERLYNDIRENYKNNSSFVEHSFKDIEDKDEIKIRIKEILVNINNEDLIVLDLNLKYFREVFNYLEEINSTNVVVNTFGSVENRFKNISFKLIQTVGNLATPSLSVEDLFLKVFKRDLPAEKKNLLLDSVFRLEIPLLISQVLDKCEDQEIRDHDNNAIRQAILSFDG